MNKEEILRKLRENREKLRKFGVKRIGIFGSFVRGEQKEESDIDIYVEFYLEEITFDKYLALEDFLEKLLGRKIDIITKEGLETIRIPYIKEEIKREIAYA